MHSSSTGLILEPWQNWAFLWLKGAVAATSTMTTAPVKMIWRDCCHPDLDAVISAHPAYCLPISTWTQNSKVPSRALCQCRYHRPSTSKAKAQQNNSLHIQIVPFHAPLCSGGGGDALSIIIIYTVCIVAFLFIRSSSWRWLYWWQKTVGVCSVDLHTVTAEAWCLVFTASTAIISTSHHGGD